MKKIFLIHATEVAINPITQAFKKLWPEAQLANLLEDSLSSDLTAEGQLTDELKSRFYTLSDYAAKSGADAILFTCSAFGEAVEWCNSSFEIPILKPNEAMIEEALQQGSNIGLLATFAPAVDSISAEFEELAASQSKKISITTATAPDALTALKSGDNIKHNELVAKAAAELKDVDIICLAQFSMTEALAEIQKVTDTKVLTTPDSAVLKLKTLLGG